jgi:hypothetical protein
MSDIKISLSPSIINRFDKIDSRLDEIEEKITDIDRRLCRLEGAFSNRECCILKNDNNQKQVE